MKNLQDVELFLLDLDGTVYIGDKEIKGAFDTIRALKKMGKKVCFFTNNSSRAHFDYVVKLRKMGLSITVDEIYTSGQVAGAFLEEKFNGKKVFLMGNEKLRDEFATFGIELSDTEPDVCVLGFDTSLTYDRLYSFCKFLYRGLPYIATHPDFNCPADDCPMPDVGAMIEMIRLTVGRTPDYITGKPYVLAGEGVKKKFDLPSEKIAMVGDRLYTDIQFGKNNDFFSILVLTGETTPAMAESSDVKADLTLHTFSDVLKLL